MTASTHWLATASAQAVLERGGNAFDAAVAGAFVLHVVEPHLNGPGGDLVGIFATADDPTPTVLMGQGPAPAGATIDRFRAEGLDLVPGAGGLAAAVPGAVDAWLLLLRDHGTWELGDVLAYAIGYARDGHPLAPAAAATIARVAQLFTDDWTTSADLWMPERRAARQRAPSCATPPTPPCSTVSSTPRAPSATTDRWAAPRASTPRATSGRPGIVAHEAAAFLAAPHRHSDGGAARRRHLGRGLRRLRRRLRARGDARVPRPHDREGGRVDAGTRDPADARDAGAPRRRAARSVARAGCAHDPRGAEARRSRIATRGSATTTSTSTRCSRTPISTSVGHSSDADGIGITSARRPPRRHGVPRRRCARPRGDRRWARASRPSLSAQARPAATRATSTSSIAGATCLGHAVGRLAAVVADDPGARVLPRHPAADDVAGTRASVVAAPGTAARARRSRRLSCCATARPSSRSARPAATSRTSGSCSCCCA